MTYDDTVRTATASISHLWACAHCKDTGGWAASEGSARRKAEAHLQEHHGGQPARVCVTGRAQHVAVTPYQVPQWYERPAT